MPPKTKVTPPIDRPLSRAYLREFTSWSTAYPPGVSEPTSLRVMENMLINREGSLAVRPGLRYLTYDSSGTNSMDQNRTIVGSHEVFFLNDGRKAYIFAVREADGRVGFRVAYDRDSDATPMGVLGLTAGSIDFDTNPEPLSAGTTYVRFLQIDNKILALGNNGDTVRIFYVGADKRAITPQAITVPSWTHGDVPRVRHPNPDSIDDPVAYPALTNPSARSSRTLRIPPSDVDSAVYYVGYYYTFSNELGESAASKVKVIPIKRRWSAWRWEETNAGTTTEPNGTETDNELKVADQLLIYPSEAAFDQAVLEGATHFNVYAIMWSNQEPVPVEGLLVGSTEIPTIGPTWDQLSVRHSPAPYDGARASVVPTEHNRYNYSAPTSAAQGLVAADRMVLVLDPVLPGVIKWTSNQLGEYLNFTGNRGGGYKTLTSGNLYVPACVKLWQNPQSADTLTILCLGIDGQSTAYYMQPGQVASQSDATNFFGFEETTATPGTVSPYGCEVLNNALFHPLEDALVKSTASNYNINHKTMTDLIQNKWLGLINKQRIVSSTLDNRLYYLVHNPEGEELEAGCTGNEVWVLDTAKKADSGGWSRWLTQGCSLRKIEVRGELFMSLVRPDGIYAFDPDKVDDDYVEGGAAAKRPIVQRPIAWRCETNTQGANRAHDAWAHLQQVSLTLGNFQGELIYGVRGYDVNGKPVDISKRFSDTAAPAVDGLPFDVEDHLLVRRQMKEWRFYAESNVKTLQISEGESGQVVQPGSGQLSLVQYRYTPISVNVGYEYGSVETFEYGRQVDSSAVNSGVPVPMLDQRRP